MNQSISFIAKTILVLAILDLVIVTFTMVSIAKGDDVYHIPFWDNQIKLITNL